MASIYLALLRGINVGGKNKIAMSDLARIFSEAGCEGVRTYIQSGNVIFKADPAVVAEIPSRVTSEIASRHALKVPVVLRTAEQMGEIAKNNPFLAGGTPEDTLHVMFMAGAPEPDKIAALDSNRSLPDQFSVIGQEVYLYLPNGAGHTKLTTDYFDSRLGTTSTGRNWRTVLNLLEMMR